MAGFAVQEGATVLCLHNGRAKPTVLIDRVTLSGSPAVGAVGPAAPWTVPPDPPTCTLPPIAGGPCASAVWVAGSIRVRSMGQPLVIQGGTAICAPTASPLTVTAGQTRVRLT